MATSNRLDVLVVESDPRSDFSTSTSPALKNHNVIKCCNARMVVTFANMFSLQLIFLDMYFFNVAGPRAYCKLRQTDSGRNAIIVATGWEENNQMLQGQLNLDYCLGKVAEPRDFDEIIAAVLATKVC